MQTRPLWLPAAPFRSHVRALIEATGLPWRAIALAARVPPATVRTLLFGRDGRHRTKIPRQTAENLLRLSGVRLHRLRGSAASTQDLRRLVLHLCGNGLRAHEVAALLRTDPHRVTSLLAGENCPTDGYTMLLARAACDARCPRTADDADDADHLTEPYAA